MSGHICPRRGEGPVIPGYPSEDHFREDGTCSFCGSLAPDEFMRRVEVGDVELGPTDKSYKVYVENKGGAPFKMTYRQCPPGATCTGPSDCTHWVTVERGEQKFYFQHLSVEQRIRFVELLDTGALKLGYPGRFYALPFFMRPVG